MRRPHLLSFMIAAPVLLGACAASLGADDEDDGTEITDEYLTCGSPQMSMFPVADVHNIGWDRASCGSGQCAATCPDRNANSDWSARDHQGIDVFAYRRAPLVAVAAGTIMRVGTVSSSSGLRVRLRDRCGWEYYYGHLDEAVVRPGDRVRAGDLIGYMGNTGTSGVHLHFNISPDGQYSSDINPFELLRATSATACGGGAAPAPAPSPTPAPVASGTLVFDPAFYLALHDDLRAAYGTDHTRARDHWERYGIAEGRRGSPELDVRYYLATYDDVRAYYGATNYRGAIDHFLQYGLREGRAGSAEVQAAYYLSTHGDLRTAFGERGYAAALDHYRAYGLREGRRAGPTFDPRAYLTRYADLRAAYGTDYRAALVHWLRYGKGERRTAVP